MLNLNKQKWISIQLMLLMAMLPLSTLVSCSHSGIDGKVSQKKLKKVRKKSKSTTYEDYIEYFEKVYETMDKNYYKEINRTDYERFIKQFDTKIFAELKDTGKSDDFIRWRSAAYLIDFMKDEEDVFSAFYPPKPAQEYESTSLGISRMDLGIVGDLNEEGFVITQVEPRSDAYIKGLRIADTIIELDGQIVRDLDQAQVMQLLNPVVDSQVEILFIASVGRKENFVIVEPKTFFKQTVFDIPTHMPGIYCLKIERFNRTTGEDMFRFMKYFKKKGTMKGFILDLRNNPGGPPLAAREISSFFLPGGDDFAYFHKKGQDPATLDVPKIPEEFKYDGPMVILIDKGSGSASELFSGILQRRRRAILLGTNSAGQVMLKSMFHFDDESMVLLITSRGHHADGTPFSFGGLIPDKYVDVEEDVLDLAKNYLVYINLKDLK